MRRSVGFLIGATLLVVLLGCGALVLIMPQTAAAQEQARRSAMARWETRTFSRYRMVLEEANCTTDYEVNAERVRWGHETPCGRGQARSVANLFALIAPDPSSSICLGSGCLCKRVTSLTVHYHPTLGYPQQIAIRNSIWPNWQNGMFWSALTQNLRNPCSGGNQHILTVRSLIPHN